MENKNMEKRRDRSERKEDSISFKKEFTFIIFTILLGGLLIYLSITKFSLRTVQSTVNILLLLFFLFCLSIFIIKTRKKWRTSSKVIGKQKNNLQNKEELNLGDFIKTNIKYDLHQFEYKIAVAIVIIVVFIYFIMPQPHSYSFDLIVIVMLIIGGVFFAISSIKLMKKRVILWKKYHNWLNK